MIIDFHTHTFPDKIAAAAVEKLSLASHIRPFSDGTAAKLSKSTKAAGVDLSIVLPVATSPKQVVSINNFAAKTNESTDETGLLSFGCIHPDFSEWSEELERVKALGLKGIKLHPVYQGADINDIRFLRILNKAGELGLIVVTHAGWDIGFPGVSHCSPEMTLRAISQVGPVKLVLAHMGGWRQWDEAEELLTDQPIWFDTSFSTGSLTPLNDGYHSPDFLPQLSDEAFIRIVRAFGADRVLFGTDSPWSDQAKELERIRALPLTDAQKDAVLGKNAQSLLNVQ